MIVHADKSERCFLCYLYTKVIKTFPSPTHPQTTPSKSKTQSNDLLDNLFGSQASNGTSSPSKTSPTRAEDDFDPRAGEAGGPEKQDFGDFNSAFGNASAPANG